MSENPSSVATGMEIALPHSGEIISLDDAVLCAKSLDEIRQLEARLREVKQDLTRAILIESERQGSKTLYLDDDLKVEVSGGTKVEYDPEVLERLRDVGLPEDRYDALVRATVTYNVNATEAKRIAGANPEYARIIELARSEREAPHRVSVSRR
jgi:hypothetical protein